MPSTTYDRTEPELAPIPEAARLLGNIGRSKTYQLINAGDLESVKIGDRRLVVVSSIRALVERLKREQAAAGAERAKETSAPVKRPPGRPRKVIVTEQTAAPAPIAASPADRR